MKQFLISMLVASVPLVASAQYAPQANVTGSTAIPATSQLIMGWATECHIQRGLQQIGNPSLGYAQTGDSTVGVGPADGSIVSLGDSGIAVLTFARPIINGAGADFAVFENGFANPQNPEEAFMELAFVEVSSDGIHYTRFPASSLTQDTAQIAGVGTYSNARKINNLAGKYISMYGTPFDLQELAGTPGLNINAITHVRVVDAIGAINQYGTVDTAGRKINDPFPTPFPTSGFDLDAVAVLHQAATGVTTIGQEMEVTVFPNPAAQTVTIRTAHAMRLACQLTDAMGRVVAASTADGSQAAINVSALPSGMYYLRVTDENNNQWSGKVFRQ